MSDEVKVLEAVAEEQEERIEKLESDILKYNERVLFLEQRIDDAARAFARMDAALASFLEGDRKELWKGMVDSVEGDGTIPRRLTDSSGAEPIEEMASFHRDNSSAVIGMDELRTYNVSGESESHYAFALDGEAEEGLERGENA